MRLSFDSSRDAANIAKHGVSLAEAEGIEWDPYPVGLRGCAAGLRRDANGRLRLHRFEVYCVVFTERCDERRIISLRKANSREVRRYAEA